MMSLEKIEEFRKGQRDSVSKLGAFLNSLNTLLEIIDNKGQEELIDTKIRQLQPLIGEFMEQSNTIHHFLNEFHYMAYYRSIAPIANQISNVLANQTMPSKRVGIDGFRSQFSNLINEISEAMIAIAQLTPPHIDINIKANNPFTAYCFILSLMKSSPTNIMVVDPYIDKSIFYRYLSELPINTIIKVVSDPGKLKNTVLCEYESVEKIFAKQYPNYERKMVANLHDRYLACDTTAYTLGGSIKDAASKSDYSVTQVSETKRNEIISTYA